MYELSRSMVETIEVIMVMPFNLIYRTIHRYALNILVFHRYL